MKDEYLLITGANGEMGHSLLQHFHETQKYKVIAFDIHPLDPSCFPYAISSFRAILWTPSFWQTGCRI